MEHQDLEFIQTALEHLDVWVVKEGYRCEPGHLNRLRMKGRFGEQAKNHRLRSILLFGYTRKYLEIAFRLAYYHPRMSPAFTKEYFHWLHFGMHDRLERKGQIKWADITAHMNEPLADELLNVFLKKKDELSDEALCKHDIDIGVLHEFL